MKILRVRSLVVVADRAGAGKTLVTCAIVHALCRAGVQAIAMKPAAQGGAGGRDGRGSSELQRLAAVSAFGLPAHALCPAVVPPAGRDGGTRTRAPSLEATVDTFRVLSTWGDVVVIEGADELREPLGLDFGSAELASELQLPFVAVVDPTSERASQQALALAALGLECAGWIANQPDAAQRDAADRLPALVRAMPGPCLGLIPPLRDPAPAAAATALDTSRLLQALAPLRATRTHPVP